MGKINFVTSFFIIMLISKLVYAQSMESNIMLLLGKTIPEGYTVTYFINCNLNLDNKPDMLVLLKLKDTSSSSAVSHDRRPLLILESDSLGLLHLIERNDFVIPCLQCGDNESDPFKGIIPDNGSFTVNLGGGTSYWWTRQITFKYNPKDKHFYYYSDEGKSFYADKDITKRRKTLTSKEFGKILFKNFNFYDFDIRKYDF